MLRLSPLLIALACTLLAPPARAADELPTIAAPIVDLADVVAPADERAIEERLVALRDRTGVQMAALVVTTLGGRPIDDYAQAVFSRWGGGSKERNDGALLVLAVKDRQSRLHLGYGLEPALTDAESAELLVAMRDDLRAERYGDAILGLVEDVADHLDYLTPNTLIAPRPPTLPQQPAAFFLVLFLGWLAALISELMGPRTSAQKRKLHRRLLPEVRTKYRNLAVLAVLPALVLIIIWALGGFGFGLAYAFTWYVGAGTGVLSHEVFIKGPIRRAVLAVLLAGLVVLLLMNFPEELLPDGGTAALVALAAGMLLLFLCGMFLSDGKSSGSYRSSGSSYRSSSSSSRSSYSSSSSSSSRSWSGGGGRSGGGGASSTW